MPLFASRRAVRLMLIVLYTMATVFVAATLPARSSFALSESDPALPGGLVAAFCHSDGASGSPDGNLPDRADHWACCAACLIAGAPGLASLFDSSISLPFAERAVEAGFIVSERIAIELPRPTSRGPPLA